MPIQVRADEKLHILAKCMSPDSAQRRYNYGYSGSNYNNIPDQERDFVVERSDFN